MDGEGRGIGGDGTEQTAEPKAWEKDPDEDSCHRGFGSVYFFGR